MGEELRCEYCDKTGFKTPQALAGLIGFKHPEEVDAKAAGEKGTPKRKSGKSPSSRRTLPLLNWLGVNVWT